MITINLPHLIPKLIVEAEKAMESLHVTTAPAQPDMWGMLSYTAFYFFVVADWLKALTKSDKVGEMKEGNKKYF